jgi:hypothetical protein
MLTIKTLREYLGMPPDTPDAIADMCLKAAKSKARTAGIPDFQNNKQYDMFLCELAACFYDNRGLTFAHEHSDGAAQRLINARVLELRYATEDEEPETFKLTITAGENTTVRVKDSNGREYGDGDVEIGTVLIITAEADEGYELKTFKVNESDKTSPAVHTVTEAVVIETEAEEEGEPDGEES